MYLEHFGFTEPPFSIAPDPRYVYLSARHAEAMAHLTYGLLSQGGGFVVLTGEVGTGKTTICRCVLEKLPDDCDVAFIFNPKLSIVELLSTLCDDLRIVYPPGTTSVKVFVDRINERLLESHARGRKTVLIIDEAQNLEPDVLEQLRLLTNLETSERKLLQIILLGQPELRERLAQPELRQVAQRVIARYHLGNLAAGEIERYVQHRLTVAGVRRKLFSSTMHRQLYRLTGGIPRLINVVCDRALLGAFVQGLDAVDARTLDQAAAEVTGQAPRRPWTSRIVAGWAIALLGVAAGIAGTLIVVQNLPGQSAVLDRLWAPSAVNGSGR